ncbi:MAG: glycogen/starch/alpha-glucan phosphorylase [Planctomycetota bacterium]
MTAKPKQTGEPGGSAPPESTVGAHGMTAEDFRRAIDYHVTFSRAKSPHTATSYDRFYATALAVRDRLVERWMRTQDAYYAQDVKRIYYFSMEFLIGRTLGNALINLEAYDACNRALAAMGLDLEDLREEEFDAGLGNGGLGRLAACFLDSMATLGLPGYGCGIRYEYGMFNQRIVDGQQREEPDPWLRLGNPWELPRPEYTFPVGFYGGVRRSSGEDGRIRFRWIPGETVLAMAYDTPVPGYETDTCNTLRLYAAHSPREFDLQYFNDGDYIRAADAQVRSENISKVLYPSDSNTMGRELRLKQEYFLAASALQDIIRRYNKHHDTLDDLPEKVAIQLNETHLAIAIPELMRILVDEYDYEWDPAWKIVTQVFAYTNHTILPEALEAWPSQLVQRLLPRHQEIIFEINHRFLRQVQQRYPGDHDRLRRMSIVKEGRERMIRMAYLAIIGSHSVNGVAALHTEILKTRVLKDFCDFWPDKFNNKTNGVTPRRWVRKANRALSTLISGHVGWDWTRDLEKLRELEPLAEDSEFRKHFRGVKIANKKRMAAAVLEDTGIEIDPATIFDVQVKRIHEYKRQLLNLLHVITLYNRIKAGGTEGMVPRTVMIGGKAAPAYRQAKLIIRLANAVAAFVNRDRDTEGLLRLVFLPNYRVSLAEKVIPAADISEQISTAGYEASGTGNMKFALNGALTVGTLDGANIEIREAVGEENFFLFGLSADEVQELKASGYRPYDYYEKDPELKVAVDMISSGHFCPDEPGVFRPLMDELLGRDQFMLLADYADYCRCQDEAARAHVDEESWTRMAILNVARMGRFSSDRTIGQYASEIWGVETAEV